MPKTFHTFLSLITFSLLCVLQVSAQNNGVPVQDKKAKTDSLSTDTLDSNRSLLLEFDFGSNRSYQLKLKTAGSDSSTTIQRYIIPSINYEANSGFFASVGFYKTPGAKKSWDEFYFDLGWDFKLSKSAMLDGSIGYSHYTYNQANKRNNVNPISHDLDAYIKHDFGFVDFKLAGAYYFGGANNDVNLLINLDHAFYIDKLFSRKDELTIDPAFTIVVATNNYYKTNIQIPTAFQKQKETAALIQSTLDDFSKFQLTNYEFSIPINYQLGKFNIELAWRHNISSNLLPSNLPDKIATFFAPVLNPKPYSYFTALVSFDFLRK